MIDTSSGIDYAILTRVIESHVEQYAISTHDKEKADEIMSGEMLAGIGIETDDLEAIVNGESPVVSDVASRFAQCLGTDREVWLNLQLMTNVYAELYPRKRFPSPG